MNRRANPSFPVPPLRPTTPEHLRQLSLALLRLGRSDPTGNSLRQGGDRMAEFLGRLL